MSNLLLLVLLVLTVTRTQATCDGVFGITRNYGQIEGWLSVVRPPSYRAGQDFEVTVVLVIGDLVPKGYPMGVDLAESANSAAEKVVGGQPVKYRVRFPVQNPTPMVKAVRVNGQEVCSENPRVYGSSTAVTLSHTLQLGNYLPSQRLEFVNQRPSPTRGYPPAQLSEGRRALGCNAFFHINQQDGRKVGVVLAPPPSDRTLDEPLTTRVSFTVSTLLQEGSSGSLNLDENLAEVADRLYARRGDVIRYRVELPVQNPVPEIIALEVNGKTVCRNNPIFSPPYSNFTQSHTLTPSSGGGSYRPVPNRPTPRPTPRPVPKPTPRPVPRPVPTSRTPNIPRLPNENTCGRKMVLQNFLLHRGSRYPAGFWPWLTAIFFTSSEGPLFQCGGSLVTERHVITAAHCLHVESTQSRIPNSDLTVVLGLHNVTSLREDLMNQLVQMMKVSRSVQHPNYNIYQGLLESDLAVLVLTGRARFTARVQPVCAWSQMGGSLVGKNGSVAGWGMDENHDLVSMVPKYAVVPVVDRQQCRDSHPQFKMSITDNNFCAGARNNEGPCSGDSGGGLYFQEGGQWVLRGIVSFALHQEQTGDCDLRHFVAYVDVARFATWLAAEMERK